MALTSILTISGVPYNATARIAARLRIVSCRRDLRAGYDELAFSVTGGAPTQAFRFGASVKLACDFGLGSGSQTKFKGEVTNCAWGIGPHGWVQAFTCSGLKYQSDRVPVTAPDLTGVYTLNRTPDDPLYVPTDSGLSLGTMFTRVLTIQSTANALSAVGIQYASLAPPVLNALTVADFAKLTIVPPQPLAFMGESLFSTLDQHLARWMPRFQLEVQPDGTVRARDTTDTTVFIPRTITLPGPGGVGDSGAMWPRISGSSARCASRLVIRGGAEIATSILSQVDGSLTPAWNNTQQTNWRLTDFTEPGAAGDRGNVTAVSANTATVQSSDATKVWASNYWSAATSVIYLTNTVATGIAVTENRQVTTNTALAAAGTSIITWDASQPLDNTGYNKYRLVALGSGQATVGRLFNVTEPHTGATGLNTYIGAHLVTRSPISIPWKNVGGTGYIFYATATVTGGIGESIPIGVTAIPSTGQFMLVQPDVVPFGNTTQLNNSGWPADVAHGLPIDVQIIAVYSRGANQAVAPPDVAGVPQYRGTSFTTMGMQVTKTIDVPSYTNQWDATAMASLANEHSLCLQDIVYEGSGEILGDPTWDVLTFNYAINYAIAGASSPWSAINAPARAATMIWPTEGSPMKVSIEFSTQRRPFQGDDLYLHPSFTGGGLLNNASSDTGIGQANFMARPGGGADLAPDEGGPSFAFQPGTLEPDMAHPSKSMRQQADRQRQKAERDAQRRQKAERQRTAAKEKEQDRQRGEHLADSGKFQDLFGAADNPGDHDIEMPWDDTFGQNLADLHEPKQPGGFEPLE